MLDDPATVDNLMARMRQQLMNSCTIVWEPMVACRQQRWYSHASASR
jgi:hypothetical protein